MKRIIVRWLVALCLVALAAATASATDVTLTGLTVKNYQPPGATAYVRVFYTDALGAVIDSAGNVIPTGAPGSSAFFKEVACPVNTMTKVAACPDFVLASTTDSSRPTARVHLLLYNASRVKVATLFSNWQIPHNQGATVTVEDLENYSRAAPVPLGARYYTADATDQRIESGIANQPEATTSTRGAMSPADKTNLDNMVASNVGCLVSQGCFLASNYGAVGYVTTDPAAACAAGVDSAEAITNTIFAAVAWGQANTGSVTVRLPAGVTCAKRAPVTANNARAQIVLPEVSMGTRKVYLTIEAPGNAASPQPFQTPGTGAASMIYSTLTGQTYSGVTGTPCIIGGPDPVNGTAHSDWTWMTVYFKNVAIRAPSNPSVCGLNLSNVNHAVVENFRADVSGVSGLPADFGEPTHPHAVALLMPLNNTDGMDYRGSNLIAGWYGGFGISELTDSTGTLYSYRNKVGLVIQSPWYHAAHVKHAIVVGSPYAVAAIDPATGPTAITGLGGTYRSHLTIDLLDIEDANSPTCAPSWATPVAHVYDPTSSLGGVIKHFRVTGCVGNDVGINPGLGWHARNVKFVDLVAPDYTPDLVYDRLFGVTASALTARRSQVNQGAAWELPGTSGTETYTSFIFQTGGGVIGSSGGINQNVQESNVSDGVVSMTGRFEAGSGSMGLVARYASKDSYWLVEWAAASNVVTLYKKTAANTYANMGGATVGTAVGPYYTMALVLSGNNIKAYANGVLVANVTDAHNSTSTKHGIMGFSNTARLTNFRVSRQ